MRLLLLLLAATVSAADLTVAWDPNPTPPPSGYGPTGGYKVYWGTSSGVHPFSQNSGLECTNTIEGLTNGVEYFIVVTAYNQDSESLPSEEIRYRIPLLTPTTPNGLRVIGLTTQMTIQWEPVGQPSIAAVIDPKLITLDYNLPIGGNNQTKGGE